ncbi:hypothetical protein LP420_09460 [Massilia sp. B-10]|nr:hypothetical protein LP420_09460 [Massilia sp. B-10]UUZ55655.1 hypothetical protein LP419_08870 [Massilia sp. H-1]
MRLTIARKIALAVIAIVILCLGTMAWVTSANLQRGFVAYLNQMQARDLDQMGSLLAAATARRATSTGCATGRAPWATCWPS